MIKMDPKPKLRKSIKKNQFCLENNLRLLRFWECDVLNNQEQIKEQILCNLKKL